MKNGVCSWCNNKVSEQDFNIHAGEHYKKQAELMSSTPSMTVTSISSVSYWKEEDSE
jgi:hypothetical protein